MPKTECHHHRILIPPVALAPAGLQLLCPPDAARRSKQTLFCTNSMDDIGPWGPCFLCLMNQLPPLGRWPSREHKTEGAWLHSPALRGN